MTHAQQINNILDESGEQALGESPLGDVSVDESAFDELSWATPESTYDSLIQVTDSYVVHARGFTVEQDIWLDEYAINFGHKRWWLTQIEDIYERSWDEHNPHDVLYWSITGASKILVQAPGFNTVSREGVARMMQTLAALDVPDDARISWAMESDGSESWSGTAAELYGGIK